MRYLHPVGLHEKFVASGVYVHFHEGKPSGTREFWSIHELPDGAQLIRVDDDWRDVDGSSVLIEAWRAPQNEGGRIERFDIDAFGARTDTIQRVRATFAIAEGLLEVGHTIDSEPRRQLEMSLPDDCIIAPESLIFGGFELAELARTNGEECPVMSYLPTFLNQDAAFRPVVHRQQAELVRTESLEVAGRTYDARCYQQRSSLAPEILTIWIDAHNVLLRYHSDDQRHSAQLTQYARRPDIRLSPPHIQN